jgi:thiol-disulfide isomerase/thioredoxin
MKKINILTILISLLFWNCKKTNEKSTTSVQIKNFKSETVRVLFASFGEKFEGDPLIVNIKNGGFILDTLITQPKKVLVQPSQMFKKLSNGDSFPIASKMIQFFIYPKKKVNITGIMQDFYVDYSADGNILNKQYSEYRKSILKNKTLGSKLFYQIEDNYAKGSNDSIIKIIETKEREIHKINRQAPLNYIEKNSNLKISGYLLAQEQKEIIQKNYTKLSESVKNSEFGIIIKEKIDKWKTLTINSTAPNFEYQTYKNGKFKLSENNEKYIVLDFWGSWCGPCIMEMPKMKEFYNKNKNEVEIIGISARDKKENWIKAIKENELDWKHILNNKEKDDLVKKYGVTGFPTKIIISKSGKIEGIFLGIKEDFFIKMNELLKE